LRKVALFDTLRKKSILLFLYDLSRIPYVTHKYNNFISGKNYIGLARKFFIMQPVPETLAMQTPPHHHLRLCILAFDAAHVVTAGGGGVDIGHGKKM
jgi:hypothetical protein